MSRLGRGGRRRGASGEFPLAEVRVGVTVRRRRSREWDGGVDQESLRRRAKIISSVEGEYYLAGRALLRGVLGEWQQVRPRERFLRRDQVVDHGPAGKHPRPLSFSYSDSRGAAAVAVSANSWVGIDVERACPPGSLEGVASRFFSADERRAVEGASEDEMGRRILEVWTAREACAKALGRGLASLPHILPLHREDRPRPPLSPILRSAAPGGVGCVTFASPSDLIVSLASDGPVGRVRFTLGDGDPFDVDPFSY